VICTLDSFEFSGVAYHTGTLVPTDPDLDEGLVAFSLAAVETCAVAESDLNDTFNSVKGEQKMM
jgi:hypothetical protein